MTQVTSRRQAAVLSVRLTVICVSMCGGLAYRSAATEFCAVEMKIRVHCQIVNPSVGERNQVIVENTNYERRIYLTLRRLMSYIYGAPILDVSRSHTTTQHIR